MTVILDLEPETEKRLETEAKRRGVSPNQFVKSILEEKLSNGSTDDEGIRAILRDMLSEGMISRLPDDQKKENGFEPIVITGKAISETVLEDRD